MGQYRRRFNKKKDPKTREIVISHFQKRCIQRLGVILKQRDLKLAMNNPELMVPILRQSNTKTHFKISSTFLKTLGIDIENSEIVLVYDKARHNFVTVLKI